MTSRPMLSVTAPSLVMARIIPSSENLISVCPLSVISGLLCILSSSLNRGLFGCSETTSKFPFSLIAVVFSVIVWVFFSIFTTFSVIFSVCRELSVLFSLLSWKFLELSTFVTDSSIFSTCLFISLNISFCVSFVVGSSLSTPLSIGVTLSLCGFRVKSQVIEPVSSSMIGSTSGMGSWTFLFLLLGAGLSSGSSIGKGSSTSVSISGLCPFRLGSGCTVSSFLLGDTSHVIDPVSGSMIGCSGLGSSSVGGCLLIGLSGIGDGFCIVVASMAADCLLRSSNSLSSSLRSSINASCSRSCEMLFSASCALCMEV